MRAVVRILVTVIVGTGIATTAVGPVAAEERTVPDAVGDTSFHDPDRNAELVVSSRPDVDYQGATVSYTSSGIDVTVWTRASSPAGDDVTHLLWLEGTNGGSSYRIVFRSVRTDVDVLVYDPYGEHPCPGAVREVAGGRISVHVPLECVPTLGRWTRFRFDSFLFEHPDRPSPGKQWHDDLPAESGFSLYRDERPADRPSPATDGPLYDPESIVGTLYRMYRAFFDREPDVSGLGYWLQRSWSGTSLPTVAGALASAPEFVDRHGTLADSEFVARIYQHVLDREPDAGGRAYWTDQLTNGMPRGVLVLNLSASAEFRAATDAGAPPAYRRHR